MVYEYAKHVISQLIRKTEIEMIDAGLYNPFEESKAVRETAIASICVDKITTDINKGTILVLAFCDKFDKVDYPTATAVIWERLGKQLAGYKVTVTRKYAGGDKMKYLQIQKMTKREYIVHIVKSTINGIRLNIRELLRLKNK